MGHGTRADERALPCPAEGDPPRAEPPSSGSDSHGLWDTRGSVRAAMGGAGGTSSRFGARLPAIDMG
eukprot:CAMPEP_0174379970 /NCGR_PEP_ID=MMETSP0811_2-20130205/123058_1 /TAXON_ID=73025 ORGANISM="Eutreptiella gymnastica-like, Strain CCMP1594" /NCGR_SAMPLE_ID=MMETSP0811_2 /ASSEMBLY_ACC=CAM_ASM_000667 /LENGTH=66 /DNA_ID=CAMNT_0015532673 /DNA_START=1118 /DNA_END=1314 /DNA_ORIENTATION=-